MVKIHAHKDVKDLKRVGLDSVMEELEKLPEAEKVIQLTAKTLMIPLDQVQGFESLSESRAMQALLDLRGYKFQQLRASFQQKFQLNDQQFLERVLSCEHTMKYYAVELLDPALDKYFQAISSASDISASVFGVYKLWGSFWTEFVQTPALTSQQKSRVFGGFLQNVGYEPCGQMLVELLRSNHPDQNAFISSVLRSPRVPVRQYSRGMGYNVQTEKMEYRLAKSVVELDGTLVGKIVDGNPFSLEDSQLVSLICSTEQPEALLKAVCQENIVMQVFRTGTKIRKSCAILKNLGYSTKQIIRAVNDQNNGEDPVAQKALGFLNCMQLVEFKEALDSTETNIALQNHKLQLLNGALKGEAVESQPKFPKPDLSVKYVGKVEKVEQDPIQKPSFGFGLKAQVETKQTQPTFGFGPKAQTVEANQPRFGFGQKPQAFGKLIINKLNIDDVEVKKEQKQEQPQLELKQKPQGGFGFSNGADKDPKVDQPIQFNEPKEQNAPTQSIFGKGGFNPKQAEKKEDLLEGFGQKHTGFAPFGAGTNTFAQKPADAKKELVQTGFGFSSKSGEKQIDPTFNNFSGFQGVRPAPQAKQEKPAVQQKEAKEPVPEPVGQKQDRQLPAFQFTPQDQQQSLQQHLQQVFPFGQKQGQIQNGVRQSLGPLPKDKQFGSKPANGQEQDRKEPNKFGSYQPNKQKDEEKLKQEFIAVNQKTEELKQQTQEIIQKEEEEPKQKSPFNPAVQVLDLQKCGLQDLGFLGGLENLRVLGLGFNELEEQQLFQLESCRKLEVLTFVGNRTSEKVFGIARKLFKNLKEAYLTSTENQIELVMNAEEEK